LPSLDKQKIWIIGGWDENKTQKTVIDFLNFFFQNKLYSDN
jgi:hypothetical protein